MGFISMRVTPKYGSLLISDSVPVISPKSNNQTNAQHRLILYFFGPTHSNDFTVKILIKSKYFFNFSFRVDNKPQDEGFSKFLAK